MAPHGDPSHHTYQGQRKHMTSWEGHTKSSEWGGDSDKWTSVRTLHFDPQSLNNYTQPPKSLSMSVEMFPNLISYLLGNHTQIVKPIHMDKKKKGHEFSYTSPSVTIKDSVYYWNDTFGEKCHWSPHPDQHP